MLFERPFQLIVDGGFFLLSVLLFALIDTVSRYQTLIAFIALLLVEASCTALSIWCFEVRTNSISAMFCLRIIVEGRFSGCRVVSHFYNGNISM